MGCVSSKAMERQHAMERQADYGRVLHSALDPVSRSISMPALSNPHHNLQDVHLVPLSSSQHTYGVSMSPDVEEAGAGTGVGSLSREDSMISMLRKLHSLDGGSDQEQPKSWAEVSSILEDLRPGIEKHINSKTINTVGEMDVRASKSMSYARGGDCTMAGNGGQILFSAQNGFAADGDSLSVRKSKFSFFSRLRRRRSAAKTGPGSLNGHTRSHCPAVLTPQGSLLDSDLESYKNALKGLTQEEWNAIQSSSAKTGISTEAPSSESKAPSTAGLMKTKNRETMMKKKEDPLERYEKKCPQGGEKTVVLYTTSLRGIRKTFEDCNSVRNLLQSFCVNIDERDISMHQDFRNELKELMGGGLVVVPRLFVKGRYIGGAEEVLQLHEEGQLAPLLESLPRVQGGAQMCDGCGGVRFVPCFECSGSRKVIIEEEVVKCPHCNENGLIQCPICC